MLQIPKILHHIWIGYSRMPDSLQRYMALWAEHHPDWQIHLWTEDRLPELEPGTFFRGDSLLQRADLLRYEILRQRGGVYVDLDLECLRPIDPLLAYTAFAAWERPGHLVGNSIIGSVAGHPALEAVIGEAKRVLRLSHPPDDPAWKITGPRLFTRVVTARDDVHLFEPERFYYPLFGKPTNTPYSELQGTYTLHHSVGMGGEKLDITAENQRLRYRLDRVQLRYEKTLRRLDGVESSRWWKLGRRLFRW